MLRSTGLFLHRSPKFTRSSLIRSIGCSLSGEIYFLSASSCVVYSRRHQSSDFSHITRNTVWGLWNEGNLFSLSAPELSYFLRVHCNMNSLDPHAKKSTLVRQVEEILSSEQHNLSVPQEDNLNNLNNNNNNNNINNNNNMHSVVVTDYDRAEETLDEADEYGDWGAEPGFEDKRELDFMELSLARMGERYDPLAPRALQLLHSHTTSDVELIKMNTGHFPGRKNKKNMENYTVVASDPDMANRIRFQRAFEWCLLNIWNMNMPAELNIGAGKVIYYRQVAKQNRNVMPLWSLQRHIYSSHPYAWFAIASEKNTPKIEQFLQNGNFNLFQDSTTSYKLTIRRAGELLDCELNDQLQCILLKKPWDRFLVCHYIRKKIPDLRLVVRARHPIKKRIADSYFNIDILRSTRDAVQSVLSPELGDVVYCCERVIRKWRKTLSCGVIIQLVETKRMPLIITRAGDEGERLEYEWIINLPQQAERIDMAALSAEVWEYGNTLAQMLEEGMEEFMAHTMTAAASFA